MANGLLDFFSSPVGQGLLGSVAAGLAGGGQNVRQNIGRGLLGGLGTYNAAQDNLIQQQRAAQQGKLFDAQMQSYQTEAEARKQAIAQKQAQQDYLESIGKVTSPRIGAQPNQLDPFKAVSLGIPVDTIKTLANAKNLGKNAIKDYKEVRMPDGSVQIVGFDEYGNRQDTGATPFKAPEFRDLGGKQVALDPVTLQPVWNGAKTMTPGEIAADRRAGEAARRDAQAVTYQQDADGNFVALPSKIQPGSVVRGLPVVSGPGLTPLRGAQRDSKLTEGEGKATLYLGQMQSASKTLDELSQKGVSPYPASVALASTGLGNIAAPAGAQQVAQAQNQWSEAYLRQKTGAATTKDEIRLNNRTFFPQIGDSDEVIQQKALMRTQVERDMRAPAGKGVSMLNQGQGRQGAPAVGTVQDGYRFKGGNPADRSNWVKEQ